MARWILLMWCRKLLKWEELSNSGEALEPLVPTKITKDFEGWINDSCKVITEGLLEKKMSYRGSKSTIVILDRYLVVKEQRVNGSCNNKNKLRLRYTLKDFTARSELVMGNHNNPSKRFIGTRMYSSISKNFLTNNKEIIISNQNVSLTLNPWFITGFVDAEGTFVVTIRNNPNKNGYWIETRFSIGLHNKDLPLLNTIKSYFGGIGTIVEDKNNNRAEFRVSSLTHLITVILPHFDKYNLITKKQADYLLFKKIVNLRNQKVHLTEDGLQEIVNIRASMNLGLTQELKLAFPKTQAVDRPLVNNVITDPNWVAGFTSGDGGFHVDVSKSSVYKLGSNVKLNFQIAQHVRDKQLMENLISYLECGQCNSKNDVSIYRVTKFSDNYTKIIPFFKQYSILGIKLLDFQDWCEIADIMKSKGHLTKEGLDQILKIKAGLNKGRNY